MIRILLVGMTHNPGGLETYMINIFSKLQGKHFHFYFINTSYQPIAYSNYIRKNNGIIFNIHVNNRIYKYFTRYHVIKKFFKQHHNFDIVHINALSVNEIYWAKAAKKYGLNNIIFQSHESNSIHRKNLFWALQKLWSIYNKLSLNHDKSVLKLAASKNCGKWMFGNKSAFKIINNGINTNYFKPNLNQRKHLKRKLKLIDNKIVITTARLHKQKNYPKIINIFKYIHNSRHNTKLVIIGTGPELNHIKNMVRELNLSNDVLFLGVQSKKSISCLLNIGDLMLMPSFYEAVPFSLTEAQSVGVPAIVSKGRIPYSADITGRVNYLSLNDSDKLWAQKSLNILNNPYNFNLRIKMNNDVRNSKYNINNSIDLIKSIYFNIGENNYEN